LKIVILGAGQVGSSVAENLVSEKNDITVVDVDGARLLALQDRFDLRTVVGSAAHPSTLIEAGIEDADMVIAVTQSDETNLVACKIAQQLFNVPTRIARVRATEYMANDAVLGPQGFGVDLAICPEQVLTDYIVKLVQFPEALQVLGDGEAIDLLLTDVVMPHMSGPDLARRLSARYPSVEVLFMSGHMDQATVRDAQLGPDARLIAKPFTMPTMLRAVREALKERAGGLRDDQ